MSFPFLPNGRLSHRPFHLIMNEKENRCGGPNQVEIGVTKVSELRM
jgi:hypothetical protein